MYMYMCIYVHVACASLAWVGPPPPVKFGTRYILPKILVSKKKQKIDPRFTFFGTPQILKKSTRAEFLGVSDGVLKRDLRPGVHQVRFCHYLLYLN